MDYDDEYDNIDEDGWDLTPGSAPTFVGLP